MSDLNDDINKVMTAYKDEITKILNGDERLIETLDMLFLLPVVLEKQGDNLDDVPPVTNEFIDGFCTGLFYSGEI